MFYLLFRIHRLDPIYEKTGVLRSVREAGVSHLYSLPSGIFPPLCWSAQSQCPEAGVSTIPEAWVFREGRIHRQLSI